MYLCLRLRLQFSMALFSKRLVETAIWLNEVATRANPGTHVLNQLRKAQRNGDDEPSAAAHRVQDGHRHRQDRGHGLSGAVPLPQPAASTPTTPSYADYFLLVAPGITIRDRLGVLRVDTQATAEHLTPPTITASASWYHPPMQRAMPA